MLQIDPARKRQHFSDLRISHSFGIGVVVLFFLISDFSAQLLTILNRVVSLTGRQHEELLPQDVLGVNVFADVEGLLQVTLYHFDVLI